MCARKFKKGGILGEGLVLLSADSLSVFEVEILSSLIVDAICKSLTLVSALLLCCHVCASSCSRMQERWTCLPVLLLIVAVLLSSQSQVIV